MHLYSLKMLCLISIDVLVLVTISYKYSIFHWISVYCLLAWAGTMEVHIYVDAFYCIRDMLYIVSMEYIHYDEQYANVFVDRVEFKIQRGKFAYFEKILFDFVGWFFNKKILLFFRPDFCIAYRLFWHLWFEFSTVKCIRFLEILSDCQIPYAENLA